MSIFLDCFYLLAMNLLALLASSLAAGSLMPSRGPFERMFAALAGFPVVAVATLIGLGVFGLISREAVVVCQLGLIALLLVGRKRGFLSTGAVRRVNGGLPDASRFAGWQTNDVLLWAVLAAALILPLLGRALLLGTSLHGDDLRYHAALPAQWVMTGSITYSPSTYHAYFPLNCEVLSLWFMLPFKADTYASLSGFFWGVFLCVVVIATCQRRRMSPRDTLLICAAVFSISHVVMAISSFAAVDIAVPATALAAALFLATGPGKPVTSVDILYSGLMAGFCVGSRVSYVTVPILLFVYVGIRSKGSMREAVGRLCLFTTAVTVAGGFWYIRNAIITGNPLFPAEIGPFDGPFGKEEQAHTKLISWVSAAPFDLSQWKQIVSSHMDWPLGLFLLAGLGYVSALRAIRRCGTLSRLLLAMGVLQILLHPFTPFSATNNAPREDLLFTPRYLIMPVLVGILLFFRDFGKSGWKRRSIVVLTIMTAWDPATRGGDSAAILVMLACILALVLVWSLVERRVVKRFKTLGVTAVVATVILVPVLSPLKKTLTDRRVFTGSGHKDLGDVWKRLEAIEPGAKLCWIGPFSDEYYPMFGRTLQFRFVFVTPNAETVTRPLHEVWQHSAYSWWHSDEPNVSLEAVSNLHAEGIDYVLTTRHVDGTWTGITQRLASTAAYEQVWNNQGCVLWRATEMHDRRGSEIR